MLSVFNGANDGIRARERELGKPISARLNLICGSGVCPGSYHYELGFTDRHYTLGRRVGGLLHDLRRLVENGLFQGPWNSLEAQGWSEGASVMLVAARARQVERLVRTNVIPCAERAIVCIEAWNRWYVFPIGRPRAVAPPSTTTYNRGKRIRRLGGEVAGWRH